MQKIKHKFWVLLAGVAMFAAVFLLTGMASGTQASAASAEEVCVHEYGDGIVHLPDCTSGGYTEYICTLCGESYRDNYTDRAEHTYSEVVVQPTCTLRTFVPSAGMSTRTIIPPRSVMIIRTK